MPVVDRRIAELLSSRICHELVAGIAAINNGVELINEIDSSVYDEAMSLIAASARQCSARLQFYRMAYGFAGHDALSGIAAVRELVGGLTAGDARVRVEITDTAGTGELKQGWGKLILNLVVFAMECLPRGGSVAVRFPPADNGTLVAVEASGQDARLSPRFAEVVGPSVPLEAVNALNVHAYYSAVLAVSVGSRFQIDERPGQVLLSVMA